MSPTQRLILALTFIESFATILIERGIYFFTCHTLGFSDRANLLLALAFSLTFAFTAAFSHQVVRRYGEKRLLLLVLAAQFATTLGMVVAPSVVVVSLGTALLGGINGLKWPVVESYMLAGDTPSRAVATVGKFSMAWSITVPLGLVAAGPLINAGRVWLFVAAIAASVPSLFIVWRLPAQPEHLPCDHPEQVPPATAWRWRHLLTASRLLMFLGFAQIWVLAAVLPGICLRLGLSVALAAGFSGVIDLLRFAAFALFGVWTGWHNRRWPLLAVMLGQPLGFALIYLGNHLAWVLVGEIIFGVSAGLVYYAALYYAMTLKSGAVEASGGHETIIGLGAAVGPGLVLLGQALGGNAVGGLSGLLLLTMAGTVWAWLGGIRPLRRRD